MTLLLIGIAVIVAAIATLVAMLPRGGKTHRLVGTEFEPYVGVAFTAAIALGFTMVLSGAIDVFAK
jgi:hypothetical protein